MPVPVSPTLRVGSDALLLNARFPGTVPVLGGAKITLNGVLCPGARETGKVIPLRLNPEPVTVAAVTVRLAPPVLLRDPDCVTDEPVTPVRLMLTGFDESCPGAMPLPDKLTLTVDVCALRFDELPFVLITEYVNDALPLADPVACGAYATVTCALPPPAMVMGAANPLNENPLPPTAACDIEMFQLLALVRTKDWVPEVPTTTLPKLTDVGFAANCPAANAEPRTTNSRGTPTFRNLHCKR